MRRTFIHFFSPTEAEIGELWESGLFSFDASVLLNVYGYSDETREELVGFLENHSQRVRLPYQFGLEYSRDRSRVIIKQVANYQEVEKELNRIKNDHIAAKHDHPYLSKKCLRSYEAIQAELAESRRKMEKLVGSDPFLARILTVFEGRVSPEPSSEQLMQMEADAQERYEKRIPPGFADIKSKDMPGACGDYIAWRQLMEISRTEGKDIILAIDDLKEDWWFIERGRTVGPRPELLEEFNRVTERRVYIYNSENFLRAAKRFIAADIRDDVIEEVTQRLASRRETQRVSQDKPVASEAAAAGAPRAMHSVDEKLVADVKPVMSASSEEDKPRV